MDPIAQKYYSNVIDSVQVRVTSTDQDIINMDRRNVRYSNGFK